MVVQEKLISAEEFGMIPDDGKRYELVEGVLVEMVRPKPLHGILQVRFGHFLLVFVEQGNLGIVTTESGYILSRNPDTVRGPDVAFLSSSRLANPDLTDFIPIAPDLAVEIVSPNDRAQAVAEKVTQYLNAGTLLVWVVYPKLRKVYVYHSNDKAEIVDINGTLDGGDVLPGFALALKDVFEGLGE